MSPLASNVVLRIRPEVFLDDHAVGRIVPKHGHIFATSPPHSAVTLLDVGVENPISFGLVVAVVDTPDVPANNFKLVFDFLHRRPLRCDVDRNTFQGTTTQTFVYCLSKKPNTITCMRNDMIIIRMSLRMHAYPSARN